MQSIREFFGSVLPSVGYPCIAWLVKGSKPHFKHKVFDNIEAMCSFAENTDFHKYDYYFCVSSLRGPSTMVGGKPHVRTQANALATRCFILDVDIHPDKPEFYANKKDALVGLKNIIQAMNLPTPTIVDSGRGYHVYWPMADGVDSKDWSAVAHKFKRAIAMIEPKLVADGTRVADSAGVLRIPGSFNLKGDELPVRIVKEFSDYVDFSTMKSQLTMVVPDASQGKRVEIGTTFEISEPVELRKLVTNCNWVRQYVKNQATVSEPDWYAMLGLVPFIKHTAKDGAELIGDDVAQLLSRGHKGYTPEATSQKYEQARLAQSGPTLCARLQSLHPEWCKGCPFFGIVKTPIQTANLDKPATQPKQVTATVIDEAGNKFEEEITVPIPPKPYFRGENGGVYIHAKMKTETGFDEVIQRIYDYDLYPTKRLRSEMTESEAMEIHAWMPRDGLKKFRLPAQYLADGKKLYQYLSDKGIIPEFNDKQGLAKYLVQYVRFLQMNKAAEMEFSRFGWRDIYTANPKFVLSDGYMTAKGNVVHSGISPHLKDASENASSVGSLEKWKEGFKVYETIPNSDPYILSCMLGFAAPLMPLTGYSGVMYNIVGDSASGKSTALRVMSSVWGKPNESQLRVEDTDNAIFNFIGYLSNIPISFDEVTKMDGDRFSTFVLAFTGGRGKMRATQTGQNRLNEAYWDTIICSSSNVSLYDKLANARRGYVAEAMRVFELHSNPSTPAYKNRIDTAMRLLNENYGVAGREYIKYVMPRIAQIKPLIERATSMIVGKGGLRNEERFWGALLACALVGGNIAKDILHLHTYDVSAVVNRVIGSTTDVREAVRITISDPASTIAEFINANLDSLLRIKDGNVDLAAMGSTMHQVKGRLEYIGDQPHRAYISIQAIKEYCNLRHIDNAWLRRELMEAGIVVNSNVQKRLTSGTKLPQVNVKTWEIVLNHPKLVSTMDDGNG